MDFASTETAGRTSCVKLIEFIRKMTDNCCDRLFTTRPTHISDLYHFRDSAELVQGLLDSHHEKHNYFPFSLVNGHRCSYFLAYWVMGIDSSYSWSMWPGRCGENFLVTSSATKLVMVTFHGSENVLLV